MPRSLLLLALGVACHPDPAKDRGDTGLPSDSRGSDSGPPDTPGAPVLVFWTVDTLGAVAAEETGWCDAIGSVTAAYGLATTCVDRGIASASWTGESHTRQLWPDNLIGDTVSRGSPECDTESVLERVARATGGAWIWGADNGVFMDPDLSAECADGSTSWSQRTDLFFEYEDAAEPETTPEEERPAHRAIDALLARTAEGGGAAVFLNTYEAGGHKPRCWFAPETPACATLYQLALDVGAVDASDDPAERWLDNAVIGAIATESERRWADDPATLRGLWSETITTQASWFRPEFVEERLDRLLDGLDRQGRLDDLVLVMLGDHGENVGTPNVITGEIQLWHSDLPTEYTAEVPVAIAPASFAADLVAAGIVGDGTQVWSTPNLAWGLLDHYGIAIPEDWPAMEPVGAASTWTCAARAAGVRIDGERSVRCDDEVCAAYGWELPTAVTDDPRPLGAVPADLAQWADPSGGAAWFNSACTRQPSAR